MKVCSRCKEEKPLTEFRHMYGKRKHNHFSYCKKCQNLIGNEWYKNHPGLRKAKKARAYQAHKEARSSWYKQYRKKNHEKLLEYDRERDKKRYAQNPGYYISKSRKRQRGARITGSFTQLEWETLKALYGNMCLSCFSDDKPLVRDHVIPLSKGGVNTIDNIQPLCRTCNGSKYTRDFDYRWNVVHGD